MVEDEMNRILLVIAVFGVAAVVAGLAIIYLGAQRAEVNTAEAVFSFGDRFLHDDTSNKTYLRGGNYTIYNCKSDTLEIISIHPPALFNQSKLSNVYFAVWEGGIKSDVSGNMPDKMIRADLISAQKPDAFLFNLEANTVSVELLSNETYENLGSSLDWTADFILIHTLPGNTVFMILGIILPDVGIVIVLLTAYSLDRLSSKTGKRI